MTEIADDRSWWADVEHLRPDGEGSRRPAVPTPRARPVGAGTTVAERAGRPAPGRPMSDRAASERREDPRDEPAAPRRLRITGGRQEQATAAPARPCRPDVAAFADALDLDGAFGAPVPAPRSREIILTGTPNGRHAQGPRSGSVTVDDADLLETSDLTVDPGRTRRTVQIRGTAGAHADVAERRALREVGEHRPRTAVERVAGRPDRIAMYVVLLGAFLVFLAVAGQSAGS